MKALTKEGRQAISEIAQKYSLDQSTVETLANALVRGNGTMAQFNIPELGGAGQWMRGGMTMVGDMFNHGLKVKVEQVAAELSDLVSTKIIFVADDDERPVSEEVKPDKSWPTIFGSPTSSGSQNNFKYAYFGPARRLVIEEDGKRYIYDTKHHQISGVSQQQGSGRSYQFTSNDGTVNLNDLSLISEPGIHQQETPELPYDVVHSHTVQDDVRQAYSSGVEVPTRTPQDIIIETIEKLNVLLEKGHITEEDFKTKKQELLARL
ncbi:SHOCT domain-containing protein [Dyadobacter sp. CY312]|uniref:SHOCT domain-containing protein n=1 Tax=Dyadobacter sp. CY312 TaxID=2907303 RepID=UPI001F398E98|nr:SHOCT domain-containing protein [Dyadobacter sp. CY312]MCE7041819.1 SHOCT domain-containing protein [Dyadobacter sp. CY312]